MKHFLAWLKCSKGVTAIEYGLLAGGISLAIVAAIFAAGDSINNLYSTWSNFIGPLLGG